MLRTKVMLGLGCLLIILLIMGSYAMFQCGSLGKQIEAIGDSQDEVAKAVGEMKRAAGAMTGALLSRATGDETQGSASFDEAWTKWNGAFAIVQEDAVNKPEEKKILDQLVVTSGDYRNRARTFLMTPGHLDAAGQQIAQKLGAETMQMLGHCDELGVVHETAVTQSGHSVGQEIRATIWLLFMLMTLACLVALAASLGLTRGLLNPLASMARSIQQVGEGDLDQKLTIKSNDEFGMLANSFNQMAAQLRTYRSNTSEELLRLNMTIRATLASFPDPIFVLNSEGTVEFRNPEADQLALKLLFAGVTRLPRKVDEKVEEVRRTGEDFLPTQFEHAIKFHVDGQDRYFLPRIVLLRDDKGAVFGVAVILENVTRMLLLDDVKSNLISTVSHELKTPLTSVRMALYLLVENTVGPLNDKQHDLVSTARGDADRLLHTLNDLLDLARLEQGPALLDLQPTSAAKLVDHAAHQAQEVAQAAGTTIETVIAPGLPEIRVDQYRIAYVFANLLTNAIKYSPAKSRVRLRAEMGQTRAGLRSVRFAVIDQGSGIPPEHQEHIFERFYRVPGTNKSGAGLGLSIAREIVTAHGGEIGVLNAEGGGTEFMFVIPVESQRTGRNDVVKNENLQ
jgi:NtrC-family two-component system sensor histidine kinase KinB